MGNKLEIKKGDVFGRLTVSCEVERNRFGLRVFETRCQCGNVQKTALARLRSGHTKSCGCLSRETCSKLFKTHGKSKSRIYVIWNGMLLRCFNKKAINFGRYGGKGIGVTKKWLKFENFWKDMGKKYEEHVLKFGEKNSTLDRKDNNKDYSLNNCVWSTLEEQARNKCNNKILELNGFKKRLLTGQNKNVYLIKLLCPVSKEIGVWNGL